MGQSDRRTLEEVEALLDDLNFKMRLLRESGDNPPIVAEIEAILEEIRETMRPGSDGPSIPKVQGSWPN